MNTPIPGWQMGEELPEKFTRATRHRGMWLPHWRKVLWVYRSSAGGWVVFVFRRGYHIKAFD